MWRSRQANTERVEPGRGSTSQPVASAAIGAIGSGVTTNVKAAFVLLDRADLRRFRAPFWGLGAQNGLRIGKCGVFIGRNARRAVSSEYLPRNGEAEAEKNEVLTLTCFGHLFSPIQPCPQPIFPLPFILQQISLLTGSISSP